MYQPWTPPLAPSEYLSDSSYHEVPSAGEDWIRMVPIGNLEVHPNASEPDVPSDVPMEESKKSKGLLTED